MAPKINLSFKQWFSSLKLKQKIRYLFLFILSIYLVFYLVMYSFLFSSYMTDYALKNNRNSLMAIGSNLTAELDNISDMSKLIMANNEVTHYLKSKSGLGLRYSQNAVTAIFDIMSAYDNIYSIFVFKSDGTYVHTGMGITLVDKEIMDGLEWRKEIYEKAGGYVIRLNGGGAFTMKRGPFSMEPGEPILSFIRQINDFNTQEPLGMLVINIPVSILEETYKDADKTERNFCYYDTNNNILSQGDVPDKLKNMNVSDSPFDQKVIRNLFSEEILSYYHIPDISMVIAGYERIGYEEIISEETAWMLIFILVITAFALVLIGAFISVYITTPIQRLVQSMGSVKSGMFRRVSLPLPDDEIGHLKDSYNEMLLEINHLINELIDKEKSIQKSELEVLQEQIKPHFLYNTIDTIGYLALENSAENVYDALETLGDFYRKFLSRGEREISIEKEIEIVKDYLKLQKLRYEDVFEDAYEVREDLLEVKVPKLILQPLVENSLYHGVRLKGEKGIIKISVYLKDDIIHIVVYDNGVGMSEKQIKDIMTSDNNKSFGFKGTIERIRYYYSCEDVYEIRSIEKEYTEVDIKIPFARGEKKDVQGNDY